MLDLSRLNRVIAVDEANGAVTLEPGVSFMDLDAHLCAIGSNLMLSVPDIGWGSVLGNALERGIGYAANGDHSAHICGLEVVLANGEVLRTGMGALPESETFALYKGGFGPTLDGLFVQSNLGVVTQMGLWLMPRPARTAACMIAADHFDDLGRLIDVLHPLQLNATIQSPCVIGNATAIPSMVSPRGAWHRGPGVIGAKGIGRIRAAMGLGLWNARFGLYGSAAMVAARLDEVRAAVQGTGLTLTERSYDTPLDRATVHPADRAQLPGATGASLGRCGADGGVAVRHPGPYRLFGDPAAERGQGQSGHGADRRSDRKRRVRFRWMRHAFPPPCAGSGAGQFRQGA